MGFAPETTPTNSSTPASIPRMQQLAGGGVPVMAQKGKPDELVL